VSTVPAYDRDDIVRALGGVGLDDGAIVFSHTSVAMLGRPPVLDPNALAALFLDAIKEVIGPAGTWILPAFTYSYTRGEPFDPARTPPTSDMGLLPTALWRHPDAHRSLDPLFSVIAFGGRARELTAGVPTSSYGADSIYARLLAADAVLMNIGLGAQSSLLHYTEEMLDVPYRYRKEFRGITIVEGQVHQTTILYNVRDLAIAGHEATFRRVDRDARLDGSLRFTRLGRGEINSISARRMDALAREGLARDPQYLVVGTGPQADG
jgi:aminoglycoside 3-N-acetyltransferase